MEFPKTPGWLDWYPNPSQPRFLVPAGSVDFFTALPTAVAVDHMGRPDVTKPVDGAEFELFVKFMRASTRTSGPRSVARSACRYPALQR